MSKQQIVNVSQVLTIEQKAYKFVGVLVIGPKRKQAAVYGYLDGTVKPEQIADQERELTAVSKRLARKCGIVHLFAVGISADESDLTVNLRYDDPDAVASVTDAIALATPDSIFDNEMFAAYARMFSNHIHVMELGNDSAGPLN